jgi:dTDP-4-dehydrorhamnose 3,5-epimerase
MTVVAEENEMQKLIEGVELKQLEKNLDARGYLCELLRKDWPIFKEFAMAYFSVTLPGVVRGWHRHPRTRQQDHMCILQGTGKIVVYDCREDASTKGLINEFVIGEENLTLVKIPGECWHGFKALGTKPVLLVNFPTRLYDYEDPDEERLPPDTDVIPYDWEPAPQLKHG